MEDFNRIWFDYLDLGRDYTRIKQELMEKDEIMRKAVAFGYGIRILRQELWETLISFILSSNNRVPRIMQIVESISVCYGQELAAWGRRYHAFPEVQKLSESSVEELAACRGGYRCRYVIGTARMIREGAVRLDSLAGMQTAEARRELTRLPGVGDKVADCTLLYSGTRYDVFPTDLWVKRVMEELYFGREASMQEIQAFAAEYFGELRGFAQQYLFYYARENRIGTR
jgi:N-glycosylase/DNA lyase